MYYVDVTPTAADPCLLDEAAPMLDPDANVKVMTPERKEEAESFFNSAYGLPSGMKPRFISRHHIWHYFKYLSFPRSRDKRRRQSSQSLYHYFNPDASQAATAQKSGCESQLGAHLAFSAFDLSNFAATTKGATAKEAKPEALELRYIRIILFNRGFAISDV